MSLRVHHRAHRRVHRRVHWRVHWRVHAVQRSPLRGAKGQQSVSVAEQGQDGQKDSRRGQKEPNPAEKSRPRWTPMGIAHASKCHFAPSVPTARPS